MEFEHNTDGIHLVYKNKALIINAAAVTKTILSDEDLINFSKSILTLNQNLGRISEKELSPNDLKMTEAIELRDINNPIPLFKYISRKDYDEFVSKGHFQLGSSKYYRDIEKSEARDGFEGFSISIIQVNNSQIPITLFRCNNYLIFCGTYVRSTGYLNKKFGEVEMEISNTFSFGTKIANSIGALGFTVGKVEYTNSKISKSKRIKTTTFSPENFIHREDIIELLLSVSIYPSLFVKPKMFEEENELRIIFEMPNDYATCHRFSDASLLDEIKFNFIL
jgi:hypothetical protein